jgi:hypothetical protein
MDTNEAPDVVSESAALRFCDLPESRRDWLRARLASCEVGGVRVYKSTAVATLCRELLGNPAIANRGRVEIQTR